MKDFVGLTIGIDADAQELATDKGNLPGFFAGEGETALQQFRLELQRTDQERQTLLFCGPGIQAHPVGFGAGAT